MLNNMTPRDHSATSYTSHDMREAFREFVARIHDPFVGVPPHKRRTPMYALRVLVYWLARGISVAFKFLLATCLGWSGLRLDEPLRRPKWW